MATIDTTDEGPADGYFASVSDLMVGVLFVFLLMLTIFALNFRDSTEDYEAALNRAKFAEERARNAEEKAREAEEKAKQEAAQAAAQKKENERLRGLLEGALTQLRRDIEDRAEVRSRLLFSLKDSLDSRGVKVSLDPNSGILRLSEDLLFNVGEAIIPKGKSATLLTLAEVLDDVLPCYTLAANRNGCSERAKPVLETLLVEGHTDKQGYRVRVTQTPGQLQNQQNEQLEYRKASVAESQARNDRLSTERALAVFNELQKAKPALTELRNSDQLPLLGFSGYGERRPVADAQGASEEDFRKNRRIDLRFVLSARTSDELNKLLQQIEQVLGGPR